MCDKYHGYEHIYTDGSKTNTHTGCAVITDRGNFKFRLIDGTTVYDAEAFAIWKALNFVDTNNINQVAFFNDSKAVLVGTQDLMTKNDIIRNIQLTYTRIISSNKSVILVWIPAHVGISGNEKADQWAKDVEHENIDTTCSRMPNSIKNVNKKSIHLRWEAEWRTKNQKLNEIKQTMNPFRTSYTQTRREGVVLTRLRIGHSSLTHSYHMSRDQPPICEVCGCQISIKHVLVECPQYTESRQKHKLSITLKTILDDDEENIKHLILFLKETNLYDKI